MKIDKYLVTVDISLEPGVYVLPDKSATGKTYLASLLKMYGGYGERVTSVTYSTAKDLDVALDPSKYDVVLLDRYDMYYGKGAAKIKEFGVAGVLLLDCKRMVDFCDFEPCRIKLGQREVVVC